MENLLIEIEAGARATDFLRSLTQEHLELSITEVLGTTSITPTEQEYIRMHSALKAMWEDHVLGTQPEGKTLPNSAYLELFE